MQITTTEAIRQFFAIAGDESVDEVEINEAVHEIGNDAAPLPVVKTTETADHYRANGWADNERLSEDGIVALRKQTGTYRSARGMRPVYVTAYIADVGDHRLVYIER